MQKLTLYLHFNIVVNSRVDIHIYFSCCMSIHVDTNSVYRLQHPLPIFYCKMHKKQ